MKIEEHERGGGYDVWVSDSMCSGSSPTLPLPKRTTLWNLGPLISTDIKRQPC